MPVIPLHLLGHIQRAMQDELVQVPRLVAEAREPVAALLGRAELVLEQRIVLRADDGEVVRHFWGFQRSIIGDMFFLCENYKQKVLF